MGYMAGRGPAKADFVQIPGGEGQATARPAAQLASPSGLPAARAEEYAHAHLIFLVANRQARPDEIRSFQREHHLNSTFKTLVDSQRNLFKAAGWPNRERNLRLGVENRLTRQDGFDPTQRGTTHLLVPGGSNERVSTRDGDPG